MAYAGARCKFVRGDVGKESIVPNIILVACSRQRDGVILLELLPCIWRVAALPFSTLKFVRHC